jgi:hypothetical protein
MEESSEVEMQTISKSASSQHYYQVESTLADSLSAEDNSDDSNDIDAEIS